MNSDAINNLIHAINPSANNSANYIKQIPYIEPGKECMVEINNIVKKIIILEKNKEYEKADKLHIQLNTIINQIYS